MLSLIQLGVTAGLTYNLVQNLKKRVILRDDAVLLDGVLKGLTLAIPVRNEFENLKILLPQIVDSRVLPEKLILLNDGSTDNTEKLILEYVKKYPWIEMLQGQEMPLGWRGKVWALEQILRNVKTPDVLFIDADVRLKSPFSLGILYREYQKRGARGFFSVFPKIVGPFGAKLLTDQVSFHLNYFLPFNADRLPTRSAVAATGQIMLARVDELEELKAFPRVRGSTHDGLKIARVYSGSGKPVVTFDGQNLFECEMYRGFVESFKGFSRNALEAYGNSRIAILGMSALVFWIFVLPYFLWPMMLLDPAFLASFLLVLFGQAILAKEYKMSLSSFASTPFRGVATIAVNSWSVGSNLLGVQMNWKGRLLADESSKNKIS